MVASQPHPSHPASSGSRPKLTVISGGDALAATAPSAPSTGMRGWVRRVLGSWWKAFRDLCAETPFPFPE